LNLLIVKLSSLGDVVHAMPAVQDIATHLPQARIDWVVERGFAPLVERCAHVRRVIPVELRRWRQAPLAAETRAQWQAFRAALDREAYDAVLDLQGLTKSALVARLARLAPGGRRVALANRTDGSSWERPTRWVADLAVPVTPRIHAVERSRVLCAAALGYTVPAVLRQGLQATPWREGDAPCVAFVHGSSRADKCWPEASWIALGRRLAAQGLAIGLPHGSEAEQQAAQRIAAGIGAAAQVWPRLDLGRLADRLAGCAGVIGVDSGLSHIAVALDLPHVQLYNFDTAWRTGPHAPHQRSVVGTPAPALEAVWQAWEQVRR
jgi:heptosyltransferase-1